MQMPQEKQEANNKYLSKAICVDFDGTLAEFADNIEEYGAPIPGGAKALLQLKENGYKIIIHTARPSTKEQIERLSIYLKKHGIPFDEININSDINWPSSKPVADLYIDDRALRFNGDWKETLGEAQRILG